MEQKKWEIFTYKGNFEILTHYPYFEAKLGGKKTTLPSVDLQVLRTDYLHKVNL